MSVAEAGVTETLPAPPRRRVSTRFLRSELRMIAGRRRNQIGMLVLAAVPVLIAIAVRSSASRPGSDAPTFVSSITDNGLFVALAALTIEMGFFLPLAISAIAGDSVAGEANTGTLRYLLIVPVSRTRLLLVKYAGVVVSAFIAAFIVTLAGVLAGLLLFGGGDLTLLSGSQLGFGAALVRVLGATAYLAVGIAALGAVGMLASTLTEQPIAAMLATVAFSTASFVLDSIPQVSWLHPYLLTHWWTAFGDLFRDPVSWHQMAHGGYVALAYAVVGWLAAWARFQSKDITS